MALLLAVGTVMYKHLYIIYCIK